MTLKFGIAVPAYGPWNDRGRLADLVDAAEALDYDSVWWPDHIAVPDYGREMLLEPPFIEPLAACGWALGRTRRIRVGTDVLVAPYRHPAQIASSAGSWNLLEPDRLILGVGIGYLRGEFDLLGVPYDERATLTEDFLRSFRDPPAGYSLCSTAGVPLWVGGNSPKAIRRAAQLGDGWHPLWMPPASYAVARRRILELRSEAASTGPFAFSFSCGATQVLDRDPGEWPAPASRAPVGTEFSYAPAGLSAAGGRPYFVGTADQLIGDFLELQEAGVEYATLRFASTDITQLERFASEVRCAFST